MQLYVKQGDIVSCEADTIITNLFEGVTSPSGATGALDKALDGAITELIANGDATGKRGETRILYPQGKITAKRVIVVGLGKREKFDLLAVRNAAAYAIRTAHKHKAEHVATIVHGAGIGGLDVASATQATAEGSILAPHKYAKTQQKTPAPHKISSLTFIEFDDSKVAAIEASATAASAICAGVKLTRDLVYSPANVVTPRYIANLAGDLAQQYGLNVKVGGRKWARKHKMGAFLAVAQGAGFKPKFVILEYNADRTDLPAIVLVGKGITFDTGGITLKPGSNMGSMKNDMGGCGAILGTMKAIAELKLPVRVTALLPCTENMPDANSYRPGDVITASNGKTIEIISTDAEGRLVMADALVYAQRYQPELVINVATLTGAVGRAMGVGVAGGIFSNDDTVREQLVAAGNTTHERIWPFPLWDDYTHTIKSDVADMKNSGLAAGGLGASAALLWEFVDYTWAHLDIANMALRYPSKAQAYEQHGATGFGVRLLVEFLRNRSS